VHTGCTIGRGRHISLLPFVASTGIAELGGLVQMGLGCVESGVGWKGHLSLCHGQCSPVII
jgi:hypothetical protein